MYIALVQRRSMFVAGSKVRNFSSNEVAGGYVEWADIAVE